jgi:hypothetical protein
MSSKVRHQPESHQLSRRGHQRYAMEHLLLYTYVWIHALDVGGTPEVQTFQNVGLG